MVPLPDRPRSESDSESSDDDEHHQPQSRSSNGNSNNNSNVNSNGNGNGNGNNSSSTTNGKHIQAAFIAGQRRRRRFTPARRIEVAAVRSVGACGECRKKKVRCTHVLKSHPIPIDRHSSRHHHSHQHNGHESSESSNPSSLSSTSSIGTHFGAYQLNELNRYLTPEPPIVRYRDSYEEDPPAGRFADANWSCISNRDPASESLARLSPQIEHYSNIIPPQFQDVKDNSYLPGDGCMNDIDDLSKTLPFHFKPSKEEKIREYLPPNGYTAALNVYPARKPVPGEHTPWDSKSGKQTTQPPKAKKDGVKKKTQAKGAMSGRATPSMRRSQSEQQQLAQMDLAYPRPPPSHRPIQQNPQQGPAPYLSPSVQMRSGLSFMDRSHSEQGPSPQASIYDNASFSPVAESVRYSYGSPSVHPTQFHPPPAASSASYYYVGPEPTSMASPESVHDAPMGPAPSFTDNGSQQMVTPQSFSPVGHPLNQRDGIIDTRFQQPRGQNPSHVPNYGTRVIPPVPNNESPYVAPWAPGSHFLSGNYSSTSTSLAPPSQTFTNMTYPSIYDPTMALPLTYNTAISSTPTHYGQGQPQSQPQPHHSFINSAAPTPVATYSLSVSQPPSLTMRGSSDVIPQSTFDAASHHSDIYDPSILQAQSFSPDIETNSGFPAAFGSHAPMDEALAGLATPFGSQASLYEADMEGYGGLFHAAGGSGVGGTMKTPSGEAIPGGYWIQPSPSMSDSGKEEYE